MEWIRQDDTALILQCCVATGIGDASDGVWNAEAVNAGCKRRNAEDDKEEEVRCTISKSADIIKHSMTNVTVTTLGAPNGGGSVLDNGTGFTV